MIIHEYQNIKTAGYTASSIFIISGLSDEETVKMFYEKKFQKIPKNNIKQSLELKR